VNHQPGAAAPDLVVVHVAQGPFEEQQVRTFLAANGIPTSVLGESLRHTHSLVVDGLGEVRILVPRSHEAAARDLLQRVADGDLELPEDLGE